MPRKQAQLKQPRKQAQLKQPRKQAARKQPRKQAQTGAAKQAARKQAARKQAALKQAALVLIGGSDFMDTCTSGRLLKQRASLERASLKAERQAWQEFLDIIAELAYDGSKFDKAKVMSEAMNDAMDHLEEQDPLFCLSDPGSAAKLHRKRCELAHAKMQEYRAEKARLKRKRRRGISFR